MKLNLVAGVTLAIFFASAAAAADMPAKAPIYKAPTIAAYNWSGFYAGLNGGYSWGQSRSGVEYFDIFASIQPPAGSTTSADVKLDGGVFGGQIGVNWQSGMWVGGLEADIQWTGQKGSSQFLCAAVTPGAPGVCLPGLTILPAGAAGTVLDLEQKLNWFGTARARLGMLFAPTVLAYVTGGLAFGEIETNATLHTFADNGPANAPLAVALNRSVIKTGWTVGGGVEARLWGNWTGKIEYIYFDLGGDSGSLPPPLPRAFIGANYSSRMTDNIVRVGINYKFDMPMIHR